MGRIDPGRIFYTTLAMLMGREIFPTQPSVPPPDHGGTARPQDPAELSDVHQPGGYPKREET